MSIGGICHPPRRSAAWRQESEQSYYGWYNSFSIYVVWTFGGQSPCTYLDSYFSTHLCSISTRFDEVYHVVDCSDWLRVRKAHFVQCWHLRPWVYRGYHYARHRFSGTRSGWGWSQGCNWSRDRFARKGVDGKSSHVYFQWRYCCPALLGTF